MKQIEVVAAIIHDDEGRIFATQRGYGDYKAAGKRGQSDACVSGVMWRVEAGHAVPGTVLAKKCIRQLVLGGFFVPLSQITKTYKVTF